MSVPLSRLARRSRFFASAIVELAVDSLFVLALRAFLSLVDKQSDRYDDLDGIARAYVDGLEVALAVAGSLLVLGHVVLSLWGALGRVWSERNA